MVLRSSLKDLILHNIKLSENVCVYEVLCVRIFCVMQQRHNYVQNFDILPVFKQLYFVVK